jgi:hypothetical protein
MNLSHLWPPCGSRKNLQSCHLFDEKRVAVCSDHSVLELGVIVLGTHHDVGSEASDLERVLRVELS